MKYFVVPPGQYVVWITCMFAEYEDRIIAGMVKKGHNVRAASADGAVVHGKSNVAGIVISLIVSGKEDTTANQVYTDLVDVLSTQKVLYYSVIVALLADAMWAPGNIQLPSQETIIKIIPGDKSNLN